MVRVVVGNWRCTEEAGTRLSTVTPLIGRNSTGKSSLAYAPYFLAKVAGWGDANEVLTHLRLNGTGHRLEVEWCKS